MPASIVLQGEPGEDAGAIADWCLAHDPPLSTAWLAEANRFFCPVGAPGRGGILLRQSSLDQLDLRGKLTGYIADGMGGDVTLPNLRVVGNPPCLTPGAADPVYLVRLADRRIDALTWTSARYQWRYNPTDPDAVSGTTAVGSWAQVLADVWPTTLLGTAPSFPAAAPTPTAAVIDRLDAHGFRVWDLVEDAAAALGCGVAYDPVADTFSVIYFPNAIDKALVVFRRYVGALEYDESPYVPPRNAGYLPRMAVVLFPAWLPGRSDREPRLVYGVAAGPSSAGISYDPTFTSSSGVAYLQDFTPARLWANGTVVNGTTLASRAAQVGAIFFDRFRAGAPQWPINRAYRGIIDDPDVRPGATFDAVGWTLYPKPLTWVLRSGLTAPTELYTGTELTGLQFAPAPTPLLANGVPVRAGGLPPELDRERDAWGHAGYPDGALSVAGAGLGPLLRRGSALRQGEWVSIGTGGRTDQRGRLWRNWEDAGPDDMVRHVLVVSGSGPVVAGGETGVGYPAVPMQQIRLPADWLQEENCYLVGPNGESLTVGRDYLARAGFHADDGKRIWATFCCGSGDSGGPGMPNAGGAGGPGSGSGGDDRPNLSGRFPPPSSGPPAGTLFCSCAPRGYPSVVYMTFPGFGVAPLTWGSNVYSTCYKGSFATGVRVVDQCGPIDPDTGLGVCSQTFELVLCIWALGIGPGQCAAFYRCTNRFVSSTCTPAQAAGCTSVPTLSCDAVELEDQLNSTRNPTPISGLALASCNPFRMTGGTISIPSANDPFCNSYSFHCTGITLSE